MTRAGARFGIRFRAALALSLAAACASTPGAPARPPNVVLVFVDDMGWGDLSCYGGPVGASPRIDVLAAQGLRFTDFYAAQPVCSASRAALLTGCYPNRIGIHGALGPRDTIGIAAAETTLAEVAKSRGYATAAFGKWHLGWQDEFSPLRHGFDEFFGLPYSHDMWPHHPENPEAWGDLPLRDGDTVVGWNVDPARFTTEFTARATAFIERCADERRPFFLYLAHPMPHVPLAVSPAHMGSSGRGLYGDVVREIDWSVGELVDALERRGLARDTLFLFASDNGPWLSYGDHAGSAGPLREGKGTTFDGGVRVPFLVRWPGRVPAGRTCSVPSMAIDVLPTVRALIGAAPAPLPIDGRDLSRLIAGRSAPELAERPLFFWYRQGDLEGLRLGRWKLHFPHGYRSMKGRELGRGGKPGRYDTTPRSALELYDLASDIGESRNVAAAHLEVVRRLERLADDARHRLGDSLQHIVGSDTRAPGRGASSTDRTKAR